MLSDHLRLGSGNTNKHGENCMKPAFAYMRTSSAANVGADKDSDKRQRAAIAQFAKRQGYRIVEEFYDAAVTGADHIDARAGFAALLERIAGNGVRTIIVETANRFARDLIVQETGHKKLRELGIELVAADSPDCFVADTPTAVMVRQILGAVAQFEKAALVAKLKVARDRKRAAGGFAGGQRPHSQTRPEAVALAKKLARGKRRSLRQIATELARQGHLNENGKPFAAMSVKNMIEG
jgi:DNA invertase Pin-like site-specific DNA recombinase